MADADVATTVTAATNAAPVAAPESMIKRRLRFVSDAAADLGRSVGDDRAYGILMRLWDYGYAYGDEQARAHERQRIRLRFIDDYDSTGNHWAGWAAQEIDLLDE